jgi:hypothetical protein
MNFKEPQPVLVKSVDGVEIPFGSSDIKGLLSLVQGNFNRAKSRMVGARCNIAFEEHPEAASRSECRDLNAGAYHVILANLVGIHKKGFVVDITRDLQVWNQPVTAFQSQVLGEVSLSSTASRLAVRSVRVETTMFYQAENIFPTWDATNGTAQSINVNRIYQYNLELDGGGRVVGGEWVSDNRPDFLWVQGLPAFSDYFASLAKVYRESLKGAPLPDPTASQAAL